MWSDPEKAHIMRQYRQEVVCPNKEEITDWWDGKIYKEYLTGKNLLQSSRELALQVFLDSVPVLKHGRGKRSQTPVIMRILNLPPHLRCKRENMIVVMVLPGPGEPSDYTSWLRPLWRDMKLLDRGLKTFDGNTRTWFSLRAWIVNCIGDMMAMRKLAGLRGMISFGSPCGI